MIKKIEHTNIPNIVIDSNTHHFIKLNVFDKNLIKDQEDCYKWVK